MQELNIDFKELNITEIKEDFNLFLFNSPNFSTEHLKLSNGVFNLIKNVKLQVITN